MVDGIRSYAQYTPSFGNVNPGLYKGVQGAAVAHSNDINNMTRFLMGAQPQEQDESISQAVKGTIPFMGIFGTIQGWSWIKKNYKHPFETIKAEKNAYINNPANDRYAFRKNAVGVLKEQKNRLFHGLTDAEKTALQANRGKLGKVLDHIPGYKKLRVSGFGQMMGKSGAGWMIAMDGAIRVFTEIVPTFKEVGTGAGLKQIGKSTVSVVGAAAGWTAGEVVGSAAGMAIGTAICPGIGTAIGKFVGGFLGGTIGMCLVNKGTKALTGKSELEKHKEAQIAQVQQEVQANPETQIQLAQQAQAQAIEVLKIDPENKEALEALASAEKILAGAQDTTAQEPAPQTETANLQTSPQFGTLTAPMAGVPSVPGFNGVSYDMNTYTQAMSTASMPKLNSLNGYTGYNKINQPA